MCLFPTEIQNMYFTDIKHDNVSKCIVFYTVEYKLVLTLIFNTLNFILFKLRL